MLISENSYYIKTHEDCRKNDLFFKSKTDLLKKIPSFYTKTYKDCRKNNLFFQKTKLSYLKKNLL